MKTEKLTIDDFFEKDTFKKFKEISKQLKLVAHELDKLEALINGK